MFLLGTVHELSKVSYGTTFLSWRRKLFKNMAETNFVFTYSEDLRVMGNREVMLSVKSFVIFIPWEYLRVKSMYYNALF